MSTPLGGIRVVHCDLVEPGQILLFTHNAGLLFQDGQPFTFLPKETPGQEAQRIVREGLAQAFPWLVLPHRQLTRRERIQREMAFDARMSLMVRKPESFVVTGVC